jgi:parallel beta-helix repeat protein
MRRQALAALAAATAAIAVGGTLVLQPSSTAAVQCSQVAATSGADTAAGTVDAPYRTAGKLAASLRSGETGCLRAGVFQQDLTVTVPGITLTSYPGERATLTGRLYIRRGANGVLVTGLNLNGKNAGLLPSPTINASDVSFTGNDVTNDHTSICFVVGSDTYGRAQRTVIRGNRIHDCGRIPSSNKDHGIYVQAADDTQIVDNVIVNNVDRGVQLYPDSQRTLVKGNVIDGNGEGIIFSGSGTTSSNNTVTGNLITFSRIRHDVESWYPSGTAPGVGNTVTGNCIFGGAQGTIGTQTGFTAANNLLVDPGYRDRAGGDYRISATSPCAALIATSLAPAGPNGEPPVAAVVPNPDPDPDPDPAWEPVVGARVKVTKTSSAQFGQAGEIAYLSGDHLRAVLLLDSISVKPVLIADIGPEH